jgi:hypothetical protein
LEGSFNEIDIVTADGVLRLRNGSRSEPTEVSDRPAPAMHLPHSRARRATAANQSGSSGENKLDAE